MNERERAGDPGATICPLCGIAHPAGARCPRLSPAAPADPVAARADGAPTPNAFAPFPEAPAPAREGDPFAPGAAAPAWSAPGVPSSTLLFGGGGLPSPPAPAPRPAGAVDPLVGAQVGSFKLVRLLGRGGMGTVYLAEHPMIGSRVAVKFLHESLAESPSVVARFYDEARAVNLIGHENIVAIFDLNLLPPNRYYFVMEFLDGETLTARMRRGRLAPTAALDVLLQLCDALGCAHDRGVVHRDLKPDNVFLVRRGGRDDFVKLVDFGIAKLRGDAVSSPGKTAAGLIVGTPEYMAPEQCDDGTIDARTDVYALGVIAYELLTGRLPFQGRTVTQLLLAHLQQEPRPLSAVEPGVDAELEAAVLTALRKDPGARHASMAALSAALATVRARLAAAPSPAPSPAPAAAPGAGARVAPPAPPLPSAAAAATDRAAPAPAAPPPGPARPPAEEPGRAAAPAAPAALVELAGATPRRALVAAEVTRGGLFLQADADLPPLFARIEMTLSHPALRGTLSLVGEVVRHVSAADAVRFRMAPGFAVQFLDLTPERRAALAEIAAASSPPPREPARPAAGGERLAELEAIPAGSHYALLGLPPDAEFGEVRRASAALRADLEALRARPAAADQPARATALLVRLEAAQRALSVPADRLLHDAQHGNFLGVARCVAAGIPAAVVEARHRELLARSPEKAREAEGHLARARVARKLRNDAAAIAAFEAALTADPLDLAALSDYTALRRGGR